MKPIKIPGISVPFLDGKPFVLSNAWYTMIEALLVRLNLISSDPVVVASLPAPATRTGQAMFVTDASATMTAGIGTVVAGGGANKVPVYSDGANWVIG